MCKKSEQYVMQFVLAQMKYGCFLRVYLSKASAYNTSRRLASNRLSSRICVLTLAALASGDSAWNLWANYEGINLSFYAALRNNY